MPSLSPLSRDLVIVSTLALVARGMSAWFVDWAPYTDPAYYTLVAQRLAEGHGFTVPVIWSFLEVGGRIPPDPSLPVPSNGHWMPLTSIVAAGAMAILGPTWRAGQLPMVLLSAALVPITFGVAWWLWRSRFVAWVASILATFTGPLLIMYPTVDNFAVYGVAGALSLITAMRAVEAGRPAPWLVLSGALTGVATLARIDGALLGIATMTAWWLIERRRSRRGVTVRGLAIGAASLIAFVAVLSPWLGRNLSTFGTLLPSTGGHTLWISTYNEQFSIGHEVTFQTYLSSGAGNIVGSKAFALLEILSRLTSLVGGVFVISFIVGSWTMRRDVRLKPFLVYFWAMVVVMALVFTFHAPKGAFYHSAPAWLPIALPLSIAAVPAAATWAGRFWHFLKREQAQRFVVVAGSVGAIALSLVGSATLFDQWSTSRVREEAAATFLITGGRHDDVIMSTDPVPLHRASGNPAVAAPFDPYPVIADVAVAYDVRWFVVGEPAPGGRDPLNLWEGGDLSVDSEGNMATFLAPEPAFERDGVRVYEVRHTTD